MSTFAVEADNLVKKFKQAVPAAQNGSGNGQPAKRAGLRWPGPRPAPAWVSAVDGVSFTIQPGEVFGLLGPNGAGKSTTIRMLCTLLEPTSGTARVAGYDVVKQGPLVRQNLGTLLAGERSIYWKLTARENLEYFAALYHIPPQVARKRVSELLERMELSARADDLVEKYSTGMKQRVAIARSLLARPPILLLDEPTLGLDPQAARRVRELVQELRAEGHTNLLTTTVTTALMLAAGALLFGFHASGNTGAALLTALPMLIGLYGFGFAFAALVLILREANTLVDVSSFLVQMLSGAQFPVSALPRWLLPLALALPLTYGLDAVRGWLLGSRTILPIPWEIVLLALFMFVMIGLGLAAFAALERRVRQRGTLGQH